MPNRTILVVDDDRKTVAAIALYLRHAGFDVSTAFNGLDAVEAVRSQSPALVILDLMLPGLDGVEACVRMRSTSPIPIIMLTARTDERDTIHGLQSGADDYVTKPFSPRELVARVYAVLRRFDGQSTAPRLLTFGDLAIDLAGRRVTLRGRPVDLTPTEFRLLETFARAPALCFTRQDLVDHVFGHAFDGLDRTIDVHVKNLRRKLEADRTRPTFILTVYGLGYRFGGAPDAP